jgi:rhamnogalacturonyl hydrolase YesR
MLERGKDNVLTSPAHIILPPWRYSVGVPLKGLLMRAENSMNFRVRQYIFNETSVYTKEGGANSKKALHLKSVAFKFANDKNEVLLYIDYLLKAFEN